MSIKSCRRSVINTNTSSNTHFFTSLLCLYSHTIQGCFVQAIHSDRSIFCFCSGSQSRTCSSRTGHRIVLGISRSKISHRKLSKIQRFNPYPSPCFCQVHFSPIDLIHSHSVSDKIKSIFSFFPLRSLLTLRQQHHSNDSQR